MAKQNFNEDEGVWRTVSGRRIFIRNGEDLSSAMQRSGKFDNIRKANKERNERRGVKSENEFNKRTKEDVMRPYRKFNDAFNKDTKDFFNSIKGKSFEEATKMAKDFLKNNNSDAIKKYGSDYYYEMQSRLSELLGRDVKDVDLIDKGTSLSKPKNEYLKDYGKINTDDRDVQNNDSLTRYTDKDGNLDPEREKMHQAIIDKYFEGKEPVKDGEEKVFMLTGGGSASGKGTFSSQKNGDNLEKYYGISSKKAIVVDSDEIKKWIKGNGKSPVELNGAGETQDLHEESSALAKRITKLAQENGFQVMLDGTGDGSEGGMLKKIEGARAKGYKIVGNYATTSIENAIVRSDNRGDKTGRYVPHVVVANTHIAVSKILPKIADKFDEVNLYDTTDGMKLIATGGGKGLTVAKGCEKEFAKFLDKANYEWNEDTKELTLKK